MQFKAKRIRITQFAIVSLKKAFELANSSKSKINPKNLEIKEFSSLSFFWQFI